MNPTMPQRPLVRSLRPVPPSTPPEGADDRYTRQAEATIFAIAQDRRELDELRKERDRLHDLNADARAAINSHVATIKQRDEEIVRLKALTDSWQHEAARLQSIIEVSASSLLQAVGQEPAPEAEPK